MIKTDRAVIVEGKYDKIKLQSVLDAVIIETDGFGIFKDKEKKALIKRLACEKGILILTDSDSAGFKIRNYVKNIASGGDVINAYIPDIFGKEKRKTAYSKEKKLGVEGIPIEELKKALEKCSIPFEDTNNEPHKKITKLNLYEDGFFGRDDSKMKRKELLLKLNLPERMSSNALVEMINAFMSADEYKKAAEEIKKNYDK